MFSPEDLKKITFIKIDNKQKHFSSKPYPKTLCVYFLIYKDQIRYVGQTKNLQNRMKAHYFTSPTKYFDKIGYIPCKTLNEANILENDMISKYDTPDNYIPVTRKFGVSTMECETTFKALSTTIQMGFLNEFPKKARFLLSNPRVRIKVIETEERGK
jgi:hypothetical protein